MEWNKRSVALDEQPDATAPRRLHAHAQLAFVLAVSPDPAELEIDRTSLHGGRDALAQIADGRIATDLEKIFADRLAVARLPRLVRAVKKHDARAVEQDDAERQVVELVLAELFDARREIGRVEIHAACRHESPPSPWEGCARFRQ